MYSFDKIICLFDFFFLILSEIDKAIYDKI